MSKHQNGEKEERKHSQTEESPRASSKFRHADIEARAYKLWVGRGCPNDSADEDWFLAAKQLRDELQ